MKSPICLGDLLRTFRDLDPTGDAVASIARLLDLLPAAEPATIVPALRVSETSPAAAPSPRDPSPDPVPSPPPAPADAPSSDRKLKPRRIESEAARSVGVLLDQADLGPLIPEKGLPRPRLEPLFLRQWTRSILTMAASTIDPSGPVDWPAVVEPLARGEVPVRLPRTAVPTLRWGVQVLVDRSDSLLPFDRDQDQLVQELKRVVGEHGVEVVGTSGVPDVSYRPPAPATPILILSDLGIGRPPVGSSSSSVSDWKAFARKLKPAGCPLIAFVPYPPRRWPRALRRLVRMVPWGRETSVSVVRRHLGGAGSAGT